MPTYFIRTSLPLDVGHRIHFASHHAEKTGNSLAVLYNGKMTESIIKCNCDCEDITSIFPEGFVATAVLVGLDQARVVLDSAEWRATE